MDILTQLRGLGCWVQAIEGQVKVTGPPDAITEPLRAQIAASKADILAQLAEEAKPSISPCGQLRIPFSSPRRYWWWAGGQDLSVTLSELGASRETLLRYIGKEPK